MTPLHRSLTAFCWLLLPALAALAGGVTASVDRSALALGETVELSLTHEGRGGGKPDLAPLQKDFDVLSTSTGSSVQIVNGDFTAQTEWRISLSPRRAGRLEIPALQWDGQQSAPVALEVAGNSAAGSGNDPAGGTAADASAPISITARLSDKQPFVQGAVLLTVELHIATSVEQASLDLPGVDGISVQQIGKDVQTTEMRNGRREQRIERQYLLTPEKSGDYVVPGAVLNAQVADNRRSDPFGRLGFGGVFQTMRPLRLRGDDIPLKVRPRPVAASGPVWLPAESLNLLEGLRPDNGPLHAGEPATLHLSLTAVGVAASQLPDLSQLLVLPEGLKAYPDQPKLETRVEDGKPVANREQDVALIATQAGSYEIPELHLSWWDTQTNSQRQATLPARSLEVLAAAGAGSAAPLPPEPVADAPLSSVPAASLRSVPASPPANPAALRVWQALAAVFAALWLGSLLLCWLLWRRHANRADGAKPNAKPAASNASTQSSASIKPALAACKTQQPHQARRAILAWAAARWPSQPPLGLNALAQRFSAYPGLQGQLQILDSACYAPALNASWNGAALADALLQLPAQAGDEASGASGRCLLPSLYPAG